MGRSTELVALAFGAVKGQGAGHKAGHKIDTTPGRNARAKSVAVPRPVPTRKTARAPVTDPPAAEPAGLRFASNDTP